MATEEILYEPPPPAPAPSMDLSAVQAKIEEAFKSGNFSELARLNALAREISNRLTMSTRTDDRFKRVQMNPDAASEADRAYADTLIRNLGAARQMVESTQRASEVGDAPDLDSPGPSVAEEVAGTVGALGAADVAGQAATTRAAAPLQAATTSAKRSLSGQAGAAVRGAKKAKEAASAAGGAVGRASQAVAKAASDPIINPTPGTPGTPGTKGAAQKALRTATAEKAAAKGASGAATRTATRAAAEAATKKAIAKSFAATAARTAPRIFGGLPLAMVEVAVGPIIAFYKTTKQAQSFLGQLEKLSDLKGGPLGVEDLDTEALDVLSTSPALLDSMLKGGVIDNTAYAFANPEGAAEMGLSVGSGGVQRGGDIFTVGDVEGARAAEPGEDFGYDPGKAAWGQTAGELQAKIDAAPKKGEPGYIGRIGEDDSTPVARKKAAGRAYAKSQGKPQSDDQGKQEGALPDIAEPERKPRPELTEAKAAKLDTRRLATVAEDAPTSVDGLYPEPGQRDPAYATPDLGPPKQRKLGQGLKKLLETFATMDIKVDSDAI